MKYATDFTTNFNSPLRWFCPSSCCLDVSPEITKKLNYDGFFKIYKDARKFDQNHNCLLFVHLPRFEYVENWKAQLTSNSNKKDYGVFHLLFYLSYIYFYLIFTNFDLFYLFFFYFHFPIFSIYLIFIVFLFNFHLLISIFYFFFYFVFSSFRISNSVNVCIILL